MMAMTASWIPRGVSEFLRAEPQVSYAGPMIPSDAGDPAVAMIQVHGLAGGKSESFTIEDILALPPGFQVPDLKAHFPEREGQGFLFAALLDAGVPSTATWAELEAEQGAFYVSLPLDDLQEAVVVHSGPEGRLTATGGGPFRLLIPAHPDACASIKSLARVSLSDRPGRDTRPHTEAEHAEVHKRMGIPADHPCKYDGPIR